MINKMFLDGKYKISQLQLKKLFYFLFPEYIKRLFFNEKLFFNFAIFVLNSNQSISKILARNIGSILKLQF